MARKNQAKKIVYGHKKHLLSEKLIYAAICGEETAVQKVIKYYEAYINSLSSRELYDGYGNVYIYRDPVLKTELQNRLITGILKFRIRE
ncbi:helix-turn-helix domain-containing protein [Pectinatus frisingensis]|uniref:helix-turn-helix domain-containing protein n=1 Tax=Pectinatus frisingensis TaxID=865 RepID=UPI0015F39A89|nr:helix-turn-helix domain-containing protein [Pectinatus frisingensis]